MYSFRLTFSALFILMSMSINSTLNVSLIQYLSARNKLILEVSLSVVKEYASSFEE